MQRTHLWTKHDLPGILMLLLKMQGQNNSMCAARAFRWWEKNTTSNMTEIESTNQLVHSLLHAEDKLVIVDFYSPGCGGCKALHPKVKHVSNPAIDSSHRFSAHNLEERIIMFCSISVRDPNSVITRGMTSLLSWQLFFSWSLAASFRRYVNKLRWIQVWCFWESITRSTKPCAEAFTSMFFPSSGSTEAPKAASVPSAALTQQWDDDRPAYAFRHASGRHKQYWFRVLALLMLADQQVQQSTREAWDGSVQSRACERLGRRRAAEFIFESRRPFWLSMAILVPGLGAVDPWWIFSGGGRSCSNNSCIGIERISNMLTGLVSLHYKRLKESCNFHEECPFFNLLIIFLYLQKSVFPFFLIFLFYL